MTRRSDTSAPQLLRKSPLPRHHQTSRELAGPIPLSEKEIKVLDFIQDHILKFKVSPSFQEIQEHFGFSSVNSVQNYIKQLRNKGYIDCGGNQKRAIRIIQSSNSHRSQVLEKVSTKPPRAPLLQAHAEVLSLPFLGRVAAGLPVERLESGEFFSVSKDLVPYPNRSFVLQVEGDSMIDEGIFEGDHLVVEERSRCENGEIVIASIGDESTVKQFFLRPYPHGESNDLMIELRPANPRLKSMWFLPDEVQIKGVLVALIRKISRK